MVVYIGFPSGFPGDSCRHPFFSIFSELTCNLPPQKGSFLSWSERLCFAANKLLESSGCIEFNDAFFSGRSSFLWSTYPFLMDDFRFCADGVLSIRHDAFEAPNKAPWPSIFLIFRLVQPRFVGIVRNILTHLIQK